MEKKSFETALKQLEQIVSDMEGGNLALDESLKKYEEGIHLSQFCKKELDRAEKKVEILLKQPDGSKKIVDFDPQSPPAESSVTDQGSVETTDDTVAAKQNTEITPEVPSSCETIDEKPIAGNEEAVEAEDTKTVAPENNVDIEDESENDDFDNPSKTIEPEQKKDDKQPETLKKQDQTPEAPQDFLF